VSSVHGVSSVSPISKSSESGLWSPPLWLGFLWGVAEGTLFFIIPDILLSWASLVGARCGFRILGTILAGSVVAGLVMYTWATAQPALSQSVVRSVPFVQERMFTKVQTAYRDHGIIGMLEGPSSGIPYKIYAVLAPPVSPLLTFLLVTIPARLERLALSWFMFTAIGWIFRRWIRNHRSVTTFLFAIFWIVVYSFYWTAI
jgi:hypothetical protein